MPVKPTPKRFLPAEANVRGAPQEKSWRHPDSKGGPPERRTFGGLWHTLTAYSYDRGATLRQMQGRVAKEMPGAEQKVVRSTLRGTPINYIYTRRKPGRRTSLTR